jgi:hypothetical protein
MHTGHCKYYFLYTVRILGINSTPYGVVFANKVHVYTVYITPYGVVFANKVHICYMRRFYRLYFLFRFANKVHVCYPA